MPTGERRYPSKDEAKKLFMDSVHFSWKSFCDVQGWHFRGTRLKYPVRDWIAEKIAFQAAYASSEIEGMMAEQSENWYHDVHATLKSYPAGMDAIFQIVKYRTNQLMGLIQDDLKNNRSYKDSKFSTVTETRIRQLADAGKACVEAKYKSLMLSELKIKEFQRAPTGESKIIFEVMGAGDLGTLKKLAHEWNNK